MSDERDFVYNKKPNRVYFSSEFNVPHTPSGKIRPMRYVSRVLEAGEREHFAQIKGENVIRTTTSGRQQIKARFYVDTRGISALTLQRFSVEPEKPHEQAYFTLAGDEIQSLLDLALLVKTAEFTSGDKVRLDVEDLQSFAVTPSAARSLLKANPQLLTEVLKNEITERDVVAVAYRRSELNRFRKLLDDEAFFAKERAATGKIGDEAVWQQFFERNPWIFGYGLFFVFTSSFLPGRLEQYVSGASVGGAGKRVDALLRTRGLISSLCFAEIKTHKTPLLQSASHRSNAWAPSRELAEAISQAQKTVDEAEQQLRRRVEPRDEDGLPTGEPAYLIRPRSVVVVGSLGEFRKDEALNEPRFTSFELFRRQLVAPEIVTFDELYERARFIVEQATEM